MNVSFFRRTWSLFLILSCLYIGWTESPSQAGTQNLASLSTPELGLYVEETFASALSHQKASPSWSEDSVSLYKHYVALVFTTQAILDPAMGVTDVSPSYRMATQAARANSETLIESSHTAALRSVLEDSLKEGKILLHESFRLISEKSKNRAYDIHQKEKLHSKLNSKKNSAPIPYRSYSEIVIHLEERGRLMFLIQQGFPIWSRIFEETLRELNQIEGQLPREFFIPKLQEGAILGQSDNPDFAPYLNTLFPLHLTVRKHQKGNYYARFCDSFCFE